MNASYPPEAFLLNMTKEAIRNTALAMGYRIPISWNKGRMASALAGRYASDPNALAPLLGLPTLLFLQHLAKKSQDDTQGDCPENIGALPDAILDLHHHGLLLLNEDDHEFIISQPALQLGENLSQLDMRRAKQLEDVEFCAIGMLNVYGALERGELIRMLQRCYSDLNTEFLEHFVEIRTRLIRHAERIRDDQGNLWWCTHWMDEPDAWIDVILARDNIPYKHYSKEFYLRAAHEDIPKKPNNYDQFVRMLVAHGFDKNEAEDLLFNEILDHNNEQTPRTTLPDFLKDIQWESLDDIKRATKLFMDFSNDTPLWFCKGHTPAELYREAPRKTSYIGKPTFIGANADAMNAAWDQTILSAPKRNSPGDVVSFPKVNQQPQTAPQKVGRNDPCPCGSGKKYKHCCGRNA